MTTLALKKPNARALVLVAHPDDETIWLGGAILHYPKIRWTIFSLCRQTDPDRAPKFKNACQVYGAKPVISDLDDGQLSLRASLPEIETRIIRCLKIKKFDYLFTHGANGEYGHPRHIGLHQTVNKLLKNKKLAANQVFYFAYQGENRGENSHCSNDLKKAQHLRKLTPAEFAKKRKIIREIYGFKKESFEYLSCLDKETFLT